MVYITPPWADFQWSICPMVGIVSVPERPGVENIKPRVFRIGIVRYWRPLFRIGIVRYWRPLGCREINLGKPPQGGVTYAPSRVNTLGCFAHTPVYVPGNPQNMLRSTGCMDSEHSITAATDTLDMIHTSPIPGTTQQVWCTRAPGTRYTPTVHTRCSCCEEHRHPWELAGTL